MPGPVFLEGDRLTLCLVEPEDATFLACQYNNPKIRYQMGDRSKPYSKEFLKERIQTRDDETGFLLYHDDSAVGHVALKHIDLRASTAELGYLIIPNKQGNGYATEAADLCLTHAFDEIGLHKVWARVMEGNTASRRVLEKLEFQQEGTLRDQFYWDGEYVDEYRFGLLQSER
ncbi:MAG: GNAT family N-acetyltransferase [Halobacteriales archaeon]